MTNECHRSEIDLNYLACIIVKYSILCILVRSALASYPISLYLSARFSIHGIPWSGIYTVEILICIRVAWFSRLMYMS